MPLKILHTADIHLGMKFAGYPEISEQLQEARFQTLERLVSTANREKCDLLAVAGDLFNTVSVSKTIITRAAHILSGFEGQYCLVLPGNHDYAGPDPGGLWGVFRGQAGDNVLVTDQAQCYPLEVHDRGLQVYPAPCQAKHSALPATGWIKELGLPAESPDWRLGLAHGSLEGVSPDQQGQYYPMRRADLESLPLDVWLLGHTHITYPAKPGSRDRVYNPGTPEPDGLDCGHGGHAFILTLQEDRTIQSRLLDTGTYRFYDIQTEVRSAQDLAGLEQQYSGTEYQASVLRLTLSGVLNREEYRGLPALEAALRSRVLHLLWHSEAVTEKIDQARIAAEFTQGSFPSLLLEELLRAQDDEALQTAYELLQEARP